MRMSRQQWMAKFFPSFAIPKKTPKTKPTKREDGQARAVRLFEITLPDGRACVFSAMTQSEARAQGKRFWELDLIPVGAQIREVVDAGTRAKAGVGAA